MFFAGQQFGKYTLVKQIGKGAYGEVWLAMRHAKFVTTKVAVKLPNTDNVDFDAIRQEAILWEQASGHPNVLPIIEADEFDGQVVIVSEYASDGTLDDYLAHAGKTTVKKAVEMAIGIAAGLEFLHSRRIVHRDVKPANVLLQGETPRLTDFGMSRVVLGQGVSMQVSGTPYYMAPEAFGRKRDRQTDIWSLGVVLYEMLTGAMPFPGEEVDDICRAVLHDKPLPMPKSIPIELRDIVFKALEKSPQDRYKSVTEFREQLINLLLNLNESDESAEVASDRDDKKSGRKVKHSDFNRTQFVPETFVKRGPSRLTLKIGFALLALIGVCAAAGLFLMSHPQPVPFRSGDKFGFSTWDKKPVVEPKYDLAQPFSDNRAMVGIGLFGPDGAFEGKLGFIDPQGNEVIGLMYEAGESFSERIAKVGRRTSAESEMRFGFIDQWGKEIVPPIFDDARSYSEELAAVRFHEKWGFIDPGAATIIPFRFDHAESFSGGFAVVRVGEKFGYVNKRGEEVVAPQFDAAGSFASGRAPVKKDGRTFFIDASGNEILSADYSNAAPFSEGVAMVTIGGKSGFIDQNGNAAVPFMYDCEDSKFSEGLAPVPLNGKFGYINKTGTLVIPFRYLKAAPFDDNLALVRGADGRDFYVSFDGTEYVGP